MFDSKGGGGAFPPNPSAFSAFLGKARIRQRLFKSHSWGLRLLISTPSGVARGSRNQGVIGGVEYYSENIIKGIDVI
jgi:hypothetical protein